MATPASTVSQAGSTDPGDTTPPTQTASLSVPSSGDEILFIISQDSELIELDLNAGDTLVISYSGYGAQTANARTALLVPVDFLILDPANEPLLEAGGLVENFVDVEVEISGIHRLVFTNPARLQGLVVLVDYYIVSLDSSPTATATPAPTVSQAGSTDPGDTTPPTQAAGLSAPVPAPTELFIISQDSELIELDLNAGDTLVISYSGFSPQTATTRTAFPVPVDFLILDPANEPLLEAGGLVRNFVDVQVKTSGIHQLVFTNPGRFQALVVLVDYYISPSTSAPTASPTATLDGNTDSESPTTTPIPPPTSTPYFGSESLFIVRQESESFQLNMVAGDLLTFTYTSYRRTTGGTTATATAALGYPVEFRLIGPLGDTVLQVEAQSQNHVELRVGLTGAYQLVFTNPHPLAALEISVEYAINL